MFLACKHNAHPSSTHARTPGSACHDGTPSLGPSYCTQSTLYLSLDSARTGPQVSVVLAVGSVVAPVGVVVVAVGSAVLCPSTQPTRRKTTGKHHRGQCMGSRQSSGFLDPCTTNLRG
jgi:hypothetical protein